MKVISLGWGVQSWTLAAMVALGELEPVDVALHSDTTWERQATYEFAERWAPWLEARGVRVVTVRDAQANKVIRDIGQHGVMIPAHTSYGEGWVTEVNYEEDDDGELVEVYRKQHVSVLNRWNNEPEIPAHHSYPDGRPSGMLRRQCTQRWKIEPMRQWLRNELKRLDIAKKAGVVEQWLGITIDEVERAKDSDVLWQVHRFPMLEKKMTRQDCINWLESHGLPIPVKSSCVFCPFHNRAAWQAMKRANGKDWAAAVEADEAIRTARPGYVAYVHPDRIPLSQVKIAEDFGATQLGFDLQNAECDSGYCFL